jgi:DNA helicase II / ATP-dependent DNA helicase PcrA
VHASKGLEFKAVFISGLEEGLCPHENSASETGGLEEERRLMYVAVTRARQRLYLSHAQSRMLHGQVRYGIPSRFLDEIPEQLLKRLNSKPAYRPSGLPAFISNTEHTNAQRKSDSYPFKIGQSVRHAKFGEGVVVSYEGNADNLEIKINFGREGLKKLAMEYARLEKI